MSFYIGAEARRLLDLTRDNTSLVTKRDKNLPKHALWVIQHHHLVIETHEDVIYNGNNIEELDIEETLTDMTALMWCCEENEYESFEYLVSIGANVNTTDVWSLLEMTMLFNRLRFVELLLSRDNIDVSLTQNYVYAEYENVIETVSRNGNFNLLEIMLSSCKFPVKDIRRAYGYSIKWDLKPKIRKLLEDCW